ncbi:MAG: hypothetical protein ACP5N3_02375 [Candidatus Nanoarchaeia archaeon]
MKKKKLLLITFSLMLIALFSGFVLASGFDPVDGPGNTFGNIFTILTNVLSNIALVFNFSWLSGNVEGFLRFIWWLLVFIVLFMGGTIAFGKIYGTAGAKTARRNAAIIAALLATTTVIFTPLSLLLWLFSTYTTVLFFIFIGVAIGGVLAIVYPVLGKAFSGWPLRIARIIGILLCWAILATVTHYASELETSRIPAATFVILPIISFTSFKHIKDALKRNK